MPSATPTGDPVTSWLNPLSLVIGALFVATCAYLSAVFLVSDARRADAPDLERYFGTRALVSALVTGALAVVGLVELHQRCPVRIRRAEGRRAAARHPLGRLRRRCPRAPSPGGPARGPLLAAGPSTPSSGRWGVAQHPYLLPQTLTISDAAAPSGRSTRLADRLRDRRPRRAAVDRAAVQLAQRNLVEETVEPRGR